MPYKERSVVCVVVLLCSFRHLLHLLHCGWFRGSRPACQRSWSNEVIMLGDFILAVAPSMAGETASAEYSSLTMKSRGATASTVLQLSN